MWGREEINEKRGLRPSLLRKKKEEKRSRFLLTQKEGEKVKIYAG